MSVTANLLLADGSASDLTVYTTASISPAANKLILCFVMAADFGFANAIHVDSVSGAGLTWVEIQDLNFDTIALERRCMAVYRALGPSPSPGALTITLDSQGTACRWIIVEFDGVDTGGTNGSAAIVQNATNRADSGTSIIGTLAAFGDVGNATVGCFGSGSVSTTLTEGSGFTKVGEVDLGTIKAMLTFRADNDTTVDMSQSVDGDMGVIALELKGDGSASPITAALLTSGQSESDTTVYSTASISPGADKILLALVHGLKLAISANNPPTCAGNGLTWVEVHTRNFSHGTGGGGETRTGLTIFRAIGSAPATGSVTFTFPDTQARASFAVIELDNADIGGVDGADAVVQVVSGVQIASPSTTPVANMAEFGDALNATFGGSAWGVDNNGISVAPGVGFAELSENRNAGVGTGLQTQFRDDNDLTVDVVFGGLPITDFTAVAFGIEIKNKSQSGPPPPPPPAPPVGKPSFISGNLIT